MGVGTLAEPVHEHLRPRVRLRRPDAHMLAEVPVAAHGRQHVGVARIRRVVLATTVGQEVARREVDHQRPSRQDAKLAVRERGLRGPLGQGRWNANRQEPRTIPGCHVELRAERRDQCSLHRLGLSLVAVRPRHRQIEPADAQPLPQAFVVAVLGMRQCPREMAAIPDVLGRPARGPAQVDDVLTHGGILSTHPTDACPPPNERRRAGCETACTPRARTQPLIGDPIRCGFGALAGPTGGSR